MTQKRNVAWVIAPLANDATDAPDSTYAAVGENFKVRVPTALRFAWEARLPSQVVTVAIVYGAGSDRAHAHGQTLAACCEQYTRRLEPELPIHANRNAKRVFGTLAEMRWIIQCAEACYPHCDIKYVFVSQRRHLYRVKWITRLFFWNRDATYIVAPQTKEIPLIREVLAYTKLLLARLGLERMGDVIRRWRTLPYDRE